MRKLNHQALVDILEDEELVLVVETLSGDLYTATYDGKRRLIDQVTLDSDVADWLNDCVERNVLYYSKYQSIDDNFKLPAPYYYDVWWDSYPEKQPFEAKKEAFQMRVSKFNKGVLF